MGRVAVFALLMLLVWPCVATAHDHGREWSQNATPQIKRWFQEQRIPGGPERGKSCCSTSDGNYAEEDIRQGEYWTRCPIDSPCPIKDWMQVPAEAVIHDPNRNGAPVVWWYFINGQPKIRCYAPGGGV